MQTSASKSFKCKDMKGAHTTSLTEHWQHVAVDVYNLKTNANSNTHQIMYSCTYFLTATQITEFWFMA